jgi:hypothetical protein
MQSRGSEGYHMETTDIRTIVILHGFAGMKESYFFI